jgi:alkylation response protein AidB-like acyl-CoA dehydrogenase
MYGLSDADLQIQARAREFTDELIPFEVTAELNNGELPADQVAGHAKRARELGLHAANMPAELGGGGCSSLQQVLVQEQVGRVTNGLAWVVGTPPSWLPAVATPYQLDRFVLPTIRGDAEECYAITEEGAGSDVDAIEATARRDGDEYVLNGEKWHVTSYNTASFAFFQAKLAGGAHDGEHAMFLVDLPSFGVSVLRTPAYSHTISHHHPIVAFRDVRVPAAHLVGAEGDGMSFAYEWFRFERLMVAARCLGAADRLVTEMTAFGGSRRVQGRPIAELGAVAAMLADSLTELFAARSLTYETARAIDAGADVKVQHAQCSMAKLYASEMAGRVADRAVQVFGGKGWSTLYRPGRHLTDVRVCRIYEGTDEILKLKIAASVLGKEYEAFR